MTTAPSTQSERSFRLAFGRRLDEHDLRGRLGYDGVCEFLPQSIVVTGTRDIRQEAFLLHFFGGLAGSVAAHVMKRQERGKMYRFEIDLSRTRAIYEDLSRRVNLALPNGERLVVSLAREVVGAEREGDYEAFKEMLAVYLGDRLIPLPACEPEGPSVAFMIVLLIFVLAMLAGVLIYVLRH
jgi:hypothetical protein